MDLDYFVSEANKSITNKEIPQAIEFLQEAYKINPKSIDICSKLGILHLQIGELESSIQYFKQSILLDPKSSIPYSNLGIIYFKLKNKSLSLKNYLKALELNPNNFLINYNLGNYYLFYDDLENAEKCYLQSIVLQPNNFWPYNNLFQIYDRSNNLKKLDQIIYKILNNFKRSAPIKFLEGMYEFRKKNYEKTIQIFSDLDIDSKDIQRRSIKENILGKCYDHVEMYSEAFKHFSISNDILYKSNLNKSDKNNSRDLVHKRLNYFSNHFLKFDSFHAEYDKYIDPVFLIGFPRSGTTLLDTILRTHKLIKVIEEKPLVPELINEINKFTKQDFAQLNTLEKNSVKKLRESYFKKMRDLVGFDRNLIYVDKLPLNIIYVAELKKIFPKAKFILCLRNPYDVILSCFMQPFIPNDAMSNFYNLNDASDYYDKVMTLWKKYDELLNLDKHVIKYEDVVNNFDMTIKSMLKFLSVDWSDDLKNFYNTAEKRGFINTPSYNQINTPLYKKSISRWKNYSDKFSHLNTTLDKWVKTFKY